jgi:hypothetical protein
MELQKFVCVLLKILDLEIPSHRFDTERKCKSLHLDLQKKLI